MSASHMTEILRAKFTAFLIAAVMTSVALASRSAEVNDQAAVVRKESFSRFNRELARFEPPASNRPKHRIDFSQDSAVAGTILKVRFDDKSPGETAPSGTASSETHTRRTTVVSPIHR